MVSSQIAAAASTLRGAFVVRVPAVSHSVGASASRRLGRIGGSLQNLT
jgi:hypothetical protein